MEPTHGNLTLSPITPRICHAIYKRYNAIFLAHARRVPYKKDQTSRGTAGELSIGRDI